MTIDWSQPICLDTVPPREARVVSGPDSEGDYDVDADWNEVGIPYPQYVRADGRKFRNDRPIRVRNLTPAELSARDGAPDDIAAKLLATQEQAAELAAALAECVQSMEYWAGCDEGCTEDKATSEIMSSGGAWPSVAYEKARAALAKWEARK